MRIPGVIWTTIIAVAIFACQTLLPDAYAVYGSMGVVALFSIAKAMNLGGDEIDKMVADLHKAQNQGAVPRGIVVPTPRKRGKVERWLVG